MFELCSGCSLFPPRGPAPHGMTNPRVLCLVACAGLLLGHLFSPGCRAPIPTTSQVVHPPHPGTTQSAAPPLTQEEQVTQRATFAHAFVSQNWADQFLAPAPPQEAHTVDILSHGGPDALAVIIAQGRHNTLAQHLHALFAQPLPIDSILVVQEGQHVDLGETLRLHPRVKHVRSKNWDTRGAWRFSIPLFLNTTFVAILDEDAVVSANWLSRAMELCKQRSGIVGTRGLLIGPRGAVPQAVVPGDVDQEVDILFHSWFFRREWIYHFWRVDQPPDLAATAMHFAASARLYGNLHLWVVRSNKVEGNASFDVNTVFHQTHADPWRERGWKPIARLQ
eukprot:GGOE01061379.1.p1 GENE.GGOE01061379.1~~GGOE01061379.1.p1  ORF type:complete len:345 (+),score=57.50 GGOE01061379.1:28-1035(+)